MSAMLTAALVKVGVEPPFFLRRLNNSSSLGDPTTPVEKRLDDAVRAVFKVDEPAHSLFRVCNADDLRRVVVALCANRQKPAGSKFFFVGISEAELTAAGVQIDRTPEDDTPCGIANQLLHFNAIAGEQQLRNLLATLFAVQRGRQHFKEQELKDFVDHAFNEGCRAGSKPPPQNCRVQACPACPPATPTPTGGPPIPPAPSI